MKEIELLSTAQAYQNLSAELAKEYLEYFGGQYKPDELRDLSILVTELRKLSVPKIIFDHFYYGYQIPQISSEFDLLRFGEEMVINIELKSESTLDKILKQLERNRYYLVSLSLEVKNFSFVSSTNTLYLLTEEGLVESSLTDLVSLLNRQRVVELENINSLFNPSNFLVSPFNSTHKFISDEYFLTNQQQQIKNETIKLVYQDGFSFISICGNAGTGKTLLTFDIVKEFINDHFDVLVVHCGNLNEGHHLLKEEYGWNILHIKYLDQKMISEYDLIVIDETQRIYPWQLAWVVKEVEKHNTNCIFSYDPIQCLREWEAKNNIAKQIEQDAQPKIFTLTNKIRTNKEVASFIKALFDLKYPIHRMDRSNIDIKYFSTTSAARDYLEHLHYSKWKVIDYTASRYNARLPYKEFALDFTDNAHSVIGQEYDNVVAVLDSHFYYDNDALSTRGYSYYYDPTKMLFQIMTRTRQRLKVVVINNPTILQRCLDITKQN